MQTKACKVCGEMKPISAFSKNKAKSDGLHYNCKPCDAKKARDWYSNNSDRAKSRGRKSRLDRLCASREYDRSYYARNKEAILDDRKCYYELNKEKVLQRVTIWAKNNREKTRSYVRGHYKRNRPEYMARSAERRASKLEATPKWLSAIDHAKIQEMYDVAEAITVQTGIKHHVDHIHALHGDGFNGLHVPWNMRVISAFENLSKGNRLPDCDAHMMWGA